MRANGILNVRLSKELTQAVKEDAAFAAAMREAAGDAIKTLMRLVGAEGGITEIEESNITTFDTDADKAPNEQRFGIAGCGEGEGMFIDYIEWIDIADTPLGKHIKASDPKLREVMYPKLKSVDLVVPEPSDGPAVIDITPQPETRH